MFRIKTFIVVLGKESTKKYKVVNFFINPEVYNLYGIVIAQNMLNLGTIYNNKLM